jgi:hypothetical protein
MPYTIDWHDGPHGSSPWNWHWNSSAEKCLADHQHFADVVTGEEEFDGSEIPKQVFDVAVVEYPLQLEAIRDGGVDRSSGPATGFPP